ncbi:helix-hairpin-helix domain-containing protein [Gordonia phosphorivorans]|uniref:Helix-hairpin-helix domain-containing protein n=1 Tax=Gordonia phosphorivorans TaxID=1056982 RepID=A0ABV6H5J6_9ACTN
MTRRSSSTASNPLDRILPRGRPDDSAPPQTLDEWGATEMPRWLDTPAGRRAWSGRPGSGESGSDGDGAGTVEAWDEVLDAEPEPEPFDEDYGDGDYGDEDYGDERRADGSETDGFGDDWGEPPRRRLAMLPPAALALIGVGVLACVIAGFTLVRSTEPAAPLVDLPASAGPTPSAEAGGDPGPPADGQPSDGQAPDGPPSATSPGTEIVVSVAGLVHKPGLVRLAPNSRVAQALERAGGTRAQADVLSLNLAQILHDGDQVLVGTREHGAASVRSAVVSSGGGPATGGGAAGDGARGGRAPVAAAKVDLNTATVAQLDTLPGVGPVTAQAIIAWREQHGGFTSVDQLAEVDGIGPARLAKLRDAVTVG